MLMPSDTAFAPVESVDETNAAIEAARAHVAKFYANGRSTLVKRFTAAQIAAWDGSDEMALVADSDGVDLSDHPEVDVAA